MSENFFGNVGFAVFPTTGLPVKGNHLGLRDFVCKIIKKPNLPKSIKKCKNVNIFTLFYTFLQI